MSVQIIMEIRCYACHTVARIPLSAGIAGVTRARRIARKAGWRVAQTSQATPSAHPELRDRCPNC